MTLALSHGAPGGPVFEVIGEQRREKRKLEKKVSIVQITDSLLHTGALPSTSPKGWCCGMPSHSRCPRELSQRILATTAPFGSQMILHNFVLAAKCMICGAHRPAKRTYTAQSVHKHDLTSPKHYATAIFGYEHRK